jgi:hypothetical protein
MLRRLGKIHLHCNVPSTCQHRGQYFAAPQFQVTRFSGAHFTATSSLWIGNAPPSAKISLLLVGE